MGCFLREAPHFYHMIVILDYPERRATPQDPFDGSYSADIQSLFDDSALEQPEFFCVFEKQMEEHFIKDSSSTAYDPSKVNVFDILGSDLPKYEGGWVKPEFMPRIEDMCAKIKERKPNAVIAMGKIAFWAVTSGARLTDHRGTPYFSEKIGAKVLGTSGLSAFTKDWSLRSIVIADINKACEHNKFKGFREKRREVYTVDDPIRDIPKLRSALTDFIAVDVETEASQITCLSLSPSENVSYVIPFWNKSKQGYHQFPKEIEELLWKFLFELLADPKIRKVFHNSLYDLSYFRHHGIPTLGTIEDTMLMHHSLSPEMQKSLGFLGSLYCDVSAWKTLNKKTKKSINKKDA